MQPAMQDDDDYRGSNKESDLDEEEYLSNEVLNENVTDPFFYQENIPEIEVQVYNLRPPEPSYWPIDPPPILLPSYIHPDPLPIVDGSEHRLQAFVDLSTMHGAYNPPVLVRLEVGQSCSSKKGEPSTTEHQGGIPSNVSVTSALSNLPIPMISISDFEDDRQNTPP